METQPSQIRNRTRKRKFIALPTHILLIASLFRYRKYYGWIRLILIRKVEDIAAIGIEEKNEPERFEKAFKGVPKSVWHVFETPEECYDIINSLIKSTS